MFHWPVWVDNICLKLFVFWNWMFFFYFNACFCFILSLGLLCKFYTIDHIWPSPRRRLVESKLNHLICLLCAKPVRPFPSVLPLFSALLLSFCSVRTTARSQLAGSRADKLWALSFSIVGWITPHISCCGRTRTSVAYTLLASSVLVKSVSPLSLQPVMTMTVSFFLDSISDWEWIEIIQQDNPWGRKTVRVRIENYWIFLDDLSFELVQNISKNLGYEKDDLKGAPLYRRTKFSRKDINAINLYACAYNPHAINKQTNKFWIKTKKKSWMDFTLHRTHTHFLSVHKCTCAAGSRDIF